jgi:hypothetical protein
MSLLAKNTGLIIISALLIFSCKEKENVGLELQTEDNKIGTIFTDTLSITTSAILKNDSIATHDQLDAYVGAYKDNVFGDVSAETFIELILANENKAVTNNLLSVELILDYLYYYGDTNQTQTIHVRKISSTEELKRSTAYYSIKAPLATDPTLLDSNISFTLSPDGYRGRIKIPLTKTFGDDLLASIGGGKTAAQFSENFKGIALSPKDDLGTLIGFRLDNNSSYINVKYMNSSSKIDSIMFFLNKSGARYSRIIRNPGTSSTLSGLTNSGNQVNNLGYIYVQAGVGITSKIKFPSLAKIKSSANVAINRADLVLELNPSTVKPTYPIKYLRLIKLNTAGDVKKYWDGSNYKNDVVQFDTYDVKGHLNPLTSAYDSTKKHYSFNISTYVNALVQGIEENNGLIIADIERNNVNRIIVEPTKIKLNIYYTKISQ